MLVCLDNDDEGKATLHRLLLDLPAAKTSFIKIPEPWKDANGLLMKCGCLKKFTTEMQALIGKGQLPSAESFTDLDDAFEQYLKQLREGSPQKYFSFPWKNVDDMATIEPGQVVAMASSRSGHGKSTFALQTALYKALHLGKVAGYYSAEMDAVRELVPMITAQLTQSDRDRLTEVDVEIAREECAGAEFYFGCDPEANTWEEVAAVLEVAVRRLRLDILVIDHLDFIIRDADWRRANAAKALAMKWRKKDLAAKYGVIVIVLRQTIKPRQEARSRGKAAADAYDWQGGPEGVTDANQVFVIHRDKVSDPKEGQASDIYEADTKIITS